MASTVTQKTFKRSFWRNSFYHNDLAQLQVELSNLETKIIASEKTLLSSIPDKPAPDLVKNIQVDPKWVKDNKTVQATDIRASLYPADMVANSRGQFPTSVVEEDSSLVISNQ